MNSTHSIGQIYPHYKAKTKQKRAGKTKSREKRGKTQKAQARTVVRVGRTAVRLPPWAVVGPTVSPWWALPGPFRLLPLHCVLSSLGASIWVANFACVGSF
uniref:Uncharacterized protein n=1 Tax=Opuntia streptacantha TaxID=393608 RepID=A0A7C9D8N3_OPUST